MHPDGRINAILSRKCCQIVWSAQSWGNTVEMMHHPSVLGWMQVLSELFRARQLRLLEQSELTVAELCTILQSPQSTVSRHLKVLVDDGWLESRRDGTSRYYQMRRDELEDARQQLWALVRQETERLPSCQTDNQRLEQVKI